MSEKFSSVIIDIRKRAESAHALAMDNPDSTTHCDAISAMLTDFVRRLVSAYDSDMDALKCENAKLRRALEPVMKCDVPKSCICTCRDEEAIREAQAIMKGSW